MVEKIIDDVFSVYEKIETKHAVKITEENINHLAKLFKGQVDWTGDKPKLLIPRRYDKDTLNDFPIGSWVDNRGSGVSDPNYGGWFPAGTYYTKN